MSEAVDLLLRVLSLVLVGGSGHSRARKLNKRLELLMAGRFDELTQVRVAEPSGQARRRAPPRDEAVARRSAAQRARKQLMLSNVQRSVRTLTFTGLVQVAQEVLQQLGRKHPLAALPHPRADGNVTTTCSGHSRSVSQGASEQTS